MNNFCLGIIMTLRAISQEDIVCHNCLKKIEFFPARMVVMEDKEGKKMSLYFHYFFPCWDFEQLCQRFPDLNLIRLGFICDSDFLTPKITKNFRKNEYLWI